jgi:hypothetical protein
LAELLEPVWKAPILANFWIMVWSVNVLTKRKDKIQKSDWLHNVEFLYYHTLWRIKDLLDQWQQVVLDKGYTYSPQVLNNNKHQLAASIFLVYSTVYYDL